MDGVRIISCRIKVAVFFTGCLLVATTVSADDEPKNAVKAEPAAAAKKAPADPEATDPKAARTEAAAAKQDEADPPKKKPPANPLTNLIRNIFGGKKPQPKPPVGQLIPGQPPGDKKLIGNGDTTARDHIDTRAPYDTQQASRLRKAEALIKNGQYKQAADWLQLVLDKVDDVDDSIVRLPDGRLVSVSSQANRLLGQFPREALDHYRQQHGDFARQLLVDALAKGDATGLAAVADKYFHTKAGHDAANYLGSQHVDRGEFGPAARRFFQLLEAKAPVTQSSPWKLKAAVVFHKAGMSDGLKQLRKQLAETGAASLQVGGRTVEPNAWLDSLGEVGHLTAPQLDEWRMLYGSPQRTGIAVGGDPLLLQRWRSPLTHNQKITEQVTILLEDLADQNRTAISAWHPLSVGNKVIFRTMRGVQVVDADSGKPLWETRPGVSPERLLTGQPARRTSYTQGINPFGKVRFNNGILSNYRSNAVDHHPLTSLLFRDGAFGMLSSHDNKLFVVEDHAILSRQQPGYYSSSSQNQNDPYRRDWSSNKLVAYNLDDGRPAWEIGGRDTKESIQLPLAGTYFFGAPTPAGRELYAVGESENEIRLYSLDPETGQPLWSQMLAVSEARIEQDLGRRWWNAQVAVSGGVIVCPTTVGWLVAIDRTSHNILWTHRYSTRSKTRKRNFGGRQVAVVPNSQYGQRWCPSAPIIVGDRVIFTPSEYTDPNVAGSSSQNAAALICLNLSDGNKLWQKPKGSYRYLAGVFDDRPVLVGTNTVTALSLEKGAVVWNRPIPATDGQPTGFGVAVGNRYHLPLNSGQLWTIDLNDGKVTRKSYLADTPGLLGNLTMHRGLLLSLSPMGLTSFEQRDAILAEIRHRKEKNPVDAWALQREADISLLNRDYEQAIKVMRSIDADQIAADQLPHYRQQMIACLTSLIRGDLPNRQSEVAELVRFAQSPQERLHARRLTAEQHESVKQYQAAFTIYLSLAEEDGRQFVERSGKTRITLPLDRWLSGRMGDLWQQMDADTRAQAEEQMAAIGSKAGDDIKALERIATLYDFHPSSRPARLRLAELCAEQGQLSTAQHHLMHLSNSPDEKVAADAIHRLAKLMQERKLSSDAGYYLKQLATRHADFEVAEGTTARALYEKSRTEGLIAVDGKAGRPNWGDYELKMERTGASYNSSQKYELKSGEFRLPYFRQFRFEIDQQQKLSVVNLADGKLHWLVPLRGKSRSSQSFPVAKAVGHRLFVLYRDVLHCLSPVERRVLWTRTLETRGRANGYYYYPNQQNTRPMQSGQSILSGQALVQQNTKTGMLAVANSSYICVYGRRKFTVLDSATGDVRWMRNHVPAYTKIIGNEDVLYMVPQRNREESVAFRATDGKLLPVENVGTLMSKAIRISDQGLVLVESRSGSSVLGLSSSSSSTVVREYDPITKKQHWTHSFPNGAYFSLVDGNTLAALRKDGTFAALDLKNGKLSELGKLSEKEAKTRSGLYVVADRDSIYLIANKSRRSGSYYSLGLPFVRVNGDVYAFDRSKGQRLWKQAVTNQNLVLSQFEHSPVMTFAMRTYIRKGQLNYWTLNVVAFDKVTGRKLVESKTPFNSSFRSFDINMAERYIELRSYNDRIRLVAINRKTAKASTPAGGD